MASKVARMLLPETTTNFINIKMCDNTARFAGNNLFGGSIDIATFFSSTKKKRKI